MALSQAEIMQCKHFLGYTAVTALARPYFDISLVFEDVLQKYMDPSWGEGYLRGTILVNILQLDTDIMNCRTRMQAVDLTGDVKLFNSTEKRTAELDALRDLRQYWVEELSRITGVPQVKTSGSMGGMEVW